MAIVPGSLLRRVHAGVLHLNQRRGHVRRVHGHGLRGLGHKVGACLVQRKPAILGHVHFILHVHRAVLVALLALAVIGLIFRCVQVPGGQ